LFINLNCNEIVSDLGYFYFDTDKLAMFADQLKKPIREAKSFSTIAEARTYRTQMLKDTALLFASTPTWLQYEGEFQFTYGYEPNTTEGVEAQIEKALQSITDTIQKNWPGEAFELQEYGGSLNNITVKIKNQTFDFHG
ncbi:MAG: hypothetical protein H7Y07_05250, partial [Pyrinomonadaceae bacterium]|nr:hypothetical protein [Sphingobacteriaceae bacterium]